MISHSVKQLTSSAWISFLTGVLKFQYIREKTFTLVSAERVNTDTIVQDMTPFYGWSTEIEKIEMK